MATENRPRARRTTSGRRSRIATIALIGLGLVFTGGAYAAVGAVVSPSTESVAVSAASIDEGEKLFATNCASCHGFGAVGTASAPSLIGVGAASVDFQVGTGRMPMQADGPQAQVKPAQFDDEQTKALADYVASLAPGPSVPTEEMLDLEGADVANGAELFRINCAMCHNVAGAGGALTEGKYAPALTGVDEKHIYEAMLTGPQNMPVFNDNNISPEDKRDIIAALKYIENNPTPGGLGLGGLGPVSEGIFIWLIGLGGIVAITVWLTAKPN